MKNVFRTGVYLLVTSVLISFGACNFVVRELVCGSRSSCFDEVVDCVRFGSIADCLGL